ARKPRCLQQLCHPVGELAQIFRNHGPVPHLRLQFPEKVHSRPFAPVPAPRGSIAPRNYPVIVKPPEMVEADHITALESGADSLHPPTVPIPTVDFPPVNWISPKLSILAEQIRRHPCTEHWPKILIQQKQL